MLRNECGATLPPSSTYACGSVQQGFFNVRGVRFGRLSVHPLWSQCPKSVDPIRFHSLSNLDATFGQRRFPDELKYRDGNVLDSLVTLLVEVSTDGFLLVLGIDVHKMLLKPVIYGLVCLSHILHAASFAGDSIDEVFTAACYIGHAAMFLSCEPTSYVSCGVDFGAIVARSDGATWMFGASKLCCGSVIGRSHVGGE